MPRSDLENLLNSSSCPTPEEEAFFSKRRALGLGVGLDEHGSLVHPKKLIFIDFEASSLSPKSWPIEVGIAWIQDQDVLVESKLIRPKPDWPRDDWSDESATVHKIPLENLRDAEAAEAVALWLFERIENNILVSDCPEFDQRWLDRLLSTTGKQEMCEIDDFDRIAWISFSKEDGIIAPGMIDQVYETRAERTPAHRAGSDAADLACAYKSGLLQRSSPDFFEPLSEENLQLWEGGDDESAE